jgi:plastocyanin
VVSPPIPVRPGFAGGIEAWAEHGRAELLRLLPPEVAASPFSTHLSASMPDEMVAATCDLFARTFAPALMLVLDRADSHGVFVRPRPGRIELCGEHALGDRLGAAAVLVAGGARACATALAGGFDLPPVLDVDLQPATGRPGLFVGRRRAFGFDLYDHGRRASLPLASGGAVAAQAYLALAWKAALAALGPDAGGADLRAGDAIVAGSQPLGIEIRGDEVEPVPPAAKPAPSPFGDMLAPRRRPGLEVVPEAATWDFTVFRLTGPDRRAWACVPGSQLGPFLQRLDSGALDDVLTGFLAAPPAGRVLASHGDTAEAGLWDEAVIGPDLLPYEGGAVPPATAGGFVRLGKAAAAAAPPPPAAAVPPARTPAPQPTVVTDERPATPTPAATPGRRGRRPAILVGALLLLLLAVTAAAMAGVFTGRGTSGVDIVADQATSSTSPPPTSTSTSVLPTTTLPPPDTVPSIGSSAPVLTVVPTTRPATTVPAATTVAVSSTVTTASTSSTTTTVALPSSFVVAVTPGILGCGFQPPTAGAVRGSTVRFRNDTAGTITVVITPPAGPGTTISLDATGTSGGSTLATPGAYAVTCSAGGDSIVGRMTVTVT